MKEFTFFFYVSLNKGGREQKNGRIIEDMNENTMGVTIIIITIVIIIIIIIIIIIKFSSNVYYLLVEFSVIINFSWQCAGRWGWGEVFSLSYLVTLLIEAKTGKHVLV